METIDLSILGELRLNKIDHIFTDITSLRDSVVWSIGSGLLGDLGKKNRYNTQTKIAYVKSYHFTLYNLFKTNYIPLFFNDFKHFFIIL